MPRHVIKAKAELQREVAREIAQLPCMDIFPRISLEYIASSTGKKEDKIANNYVDVAVAPRQENSDTEITRSASCNNRCYLTSSCLTCSQCFISF